jgi:hypothetical protein
MRNGGLPPAHLPSPLAAIFLKKFDKINNKFDEINTRLDRMQTTIAAVCDKFTQRLAILDDNNNDEKR